ncbi:hypothetical protein TKK_0014661 [Trichogramma kaykai]
MSCDKVNSFSRAEKSVANAIVQLVSEFQEINFQNIGRGSLIHKIIIKLHWGLEKKWINKIKAIWNKNVDVREYVRAQLSLKSKNFYEQEGKIKTISKSSVTQLDSRVFENNSLTSSNKINNDFDKIECEGKSYRVINNKGNGACLFRAFSQYLLGYEDDHFQLRTSVVNYVVENWGEVFEWLRLTCVETTYNTPVEYADDMGRERCLGTDFEIFIFSKMHQIPLTVFRKTDVVKKICTFKCDGSEKAHLNILFMGSDRDGHWALLREMDKFNEASNSFVANDIISTICAMNDLPSKSNLPETETKLADSCNIVDINKTDSCININKIPYISPSKVYSNISSVENDVTENSTNNMYEFSTCKTLCTVDNICAPRTSDPLPLTDIVSQCMQGSVDSNTLPYSLEDNVKLLDNDGKKSTDAYIHESPPFNIYDVDMTGIDDDDDDNVSISSNKVILNESEGVITGSLSINQSDPKLKSYTNKKFDFNFESSETEEIDGEKVSENTEMRSSTRFSEKCKGSKENVTSESEKKSVKFESKESKEIEIEQASESAKLKKKLSTKIRSFARVPENMLSKDNHYDFQTDSEANDSDEDMPVDKKKSTGNVKKTVFSFDIGVLQINSTKFDNALGFTENDKVRKVIENEMLYTIESTCLLGFRGGIRKNERDIVLYGLCRLADHKKARFRFQIDKLNDQIDELNTDLKKPVRGAARKILQEKLQDGSVFSHMFKQAVEAAKNMDIINDGHPMNTHNAQVAYQAKSELLCSERLRLESRDLLDLNQLWIVQKETKVDRFLRKIGLPLLAIMYTYVNTAALMNVQNLIVHADATGSITRKPQDIESKRIYMYVVVAKVESVQFMMLAMISSEHDIPSQKTYLEDYKYFVLKNFKRWPIAKAVVVDWSCSAIHAFCGAWNEIKFIEYLKILYL